MAKKSLEVENGETKKYTPTTTQTVSVGGRDIQVQKPVTNNQVSSPTTSNKTNTQTSNVTVGGRPLSTKQVNTTVANSLVNTAKKYNSQPVQEKTQRVQEANPYKKQYTENDYNVLKDNLMQGTEDPRYTALWANIDYKDMWSDEDKQYFDQHEQFLNNVGTEAQIAKGDVASQKKVEDTKKDSEIKDVVDVDSEGNVKWKDFTEEYTKYDDELKDLEKQEQEYEFILKSTSPTGTQYNAIKQQSDYVKNRIEEINALKNSLGDKMAYQQALQERGQFEWLRENGTRDEFMEYAKYTGGYMNSVLDDIALNYEASQFRKLSGVMTFIENVKQTYGEKASKRITETVTKLYENGDVTEEEKNEVLQYARNILDRNTTVPGESVGIALNDIANQLAQMQENGETATEKLFVDVVGNVIDNSLGQLGPAIALGRAGMYASTAVMSMSGYTQTYQQDIEAGFTHEQAMMDAMLQSGVEFMSELIGGERILRFAEGEILPRTFGQAILEGIKSGTAESVEEGLGWAATPIAHYVATGEVPNIESWNPEELKQAVTTAFLAGFVQAEVSADYSQFGMAAPLSGTERVLKGFLTISTDEGKTRVQDLVKELDVMMPDASVRNNIVLSDGTRISEQDYIGIVKRIAEEQIAEYDNKVQVKGVEIYNPNRVDTIQSLAEDSRYALKEALEPSRLKEINSLYESYNAGQTIQTINEKYAEETEKRMVAQESERMAQIQSELEEEGINASATTWDSLSDEAKTNAAIVSQIGQVLKGTPIEIADLRTKDGKIVDGFYLNGRIVVNPNAKLGAISTLIHEYTHGIESSKYYQLLRAEVRDLLGNNYESMIDDLIDNYSDIKKLSREEAEKELVANTTQRLLNNQDFINRLVKYNTNMAYKMYVDLKSMSSLSTYAEEIAQNFVRGFADANPDDVIGGMAVEYSYIKNTEINDAQKKLFDKMKNKGRKFNFDNKDLQTAIDQMEVMADLMSENSSLLPNEVIGKVLLDDASYGKTVENSTKCPRTLAYDQLTMYVSDEVGRPLTAIESFLVSQKLYQIAVDPQCLYCYVALDRKSYEEFVGKYIKQRDEALKQYAEAGSPELVENKYYDRYYEIRSQLDEIQAQINAIDADEALTKKEKNAKKKKLEAKKRNIDKEEFKQITNDYVATFTEDNPLFKEFLDGRKPTENMVTRYKTWIDLYNKGDYLLTEYDIRTAKSRDEIVQNQGEGWEQMADMLEYAQAASWAKKAIDYRAYLDDIRKLPQRTIDNLNKHYGLRWYSFNDYTPAYILENMQQFTDAALKGLKGLAYTKDVDFAEIFAPTGANINISMYATKLPDGSIGIDPLMSAELERAIALREKYPNVGIVITATNNETVEWALNREWSDVVIPFHIVRTGADIADYYKWTVYNQEQNDTVLPDSRKWEEYVKNIEESGGKSPSKMIYPSEHQNNFEKYMELCKQRGLKPRFSSFLSNPNYMKLVNETRQSEGQTQYLVPKFDMDAAQVSFQKFVDKGGYYGGWYKDGIDAKAEANNVANDILAINEGLKKYEDIGYGEGYVSFDTMKKLYDLRNKRALAKVHGRGNQSQYSYTGNVGLENLERYLAEHPDSKDRLLFDNLIERRNIATDMRAERDEDGNRVYTDDEIYKRTGWLIDPRDGFKGEFYDDGSVDKILEWEKTNKGKSKDFKDDSTNTKLRDIVGEDSLFLKMYPDLADTYVFIANTPSKTWGYMTSSGADENGYLKGRAKRIRISRKGWEYYPDPNGDYINSLTQERLSKRSRALTEDEKKNTIAHEIQHAIQLYERFYYGDDSYKYWDKPGEVEARRVGEQQVDPTIRIVDENGKIISNDGSIITEVSTRPDNGNEETDGSTDGMDSFDTSEQLEDSNGQDGQETADTTEDDSGNGTDNSEPTVKNNEDKNAKIVKRQEKDIKDYFKDAKTRAKNLIIDRYAAIDELADQYANERLVHLADQVMRVQGLANTAIYNGIFDKDGKKKIGKSLTEIMGKIPQQNRDAFDEYMYHWRNVDEMTMFDRMAKEQLEEVNQNLLYYEDGELTDEEKEEKKELEKRKEELLRYKNRPVFGKEVTADASREKIAEIESEHPEFKQIAEDIWKLNRTLLEMRRDAGIISQDALDRFFEERPHYTRIIRDVENGGTGGSNVNPNDIKRFKGSTRDLFTVEEAMRQHILSTYRVIANNELNNEIAKTLGVSENVEGDDVETLAEEEFKTQDDNGKDIYAYKDGKKYAIPVSKEVYNALSPVRDFDNPLAKVGDYTVSKLSKLRRALLTNWNPIFSLITNPIKDIQDAVRNTKYLKKYPRAFALAINDIAKNGEYSRQYDNLGIRTSQYVGKDVLEAFQEMESDKGMKKFLNRLTEFGENIEKIPRLAEFIASLEAGNSVEQAAYDAAEVTTNFKRGGSLVKTMDKYGFTFLNASVQGFDKQIRNAKGDIKKIRKAGIKGVISVLARLTLASGLPLRWLQDWWWRDDDDYKELSEYIKDNYYIVAKAGNRFIRIPKGRIASFYQTIVKDTTKTIQQKMNLWDAMLDTWQSFENNVAPNNFMDNNLLSPISQVKNNKTWYGEDLLPSRLEKYQNADQYDESTDALSIKIGELSRKVADAVGNDKLQISPYKLNYLLDQYTGIIGDVALPALTLETETSIDNPVGKGIATAILDKFTTDPVLKNQNVTSFYSLKEELDKRATVKGISEDVKLSSKYLGTVASAMGKLYGEIHDIQGDPNLSNKEKMTKVRELQKQINDMARDGLANYDNIDITGNYATVGGVQYYKGEDGWTKPSKKQLENMDGLSNEDRDSYMKTISEITSIRKDIKDKTPEGQTATYTKETVDAISNSKMSAAGKNTLFDTYYSGKATDHINAMDLTDEQKYDLKVANKTAEGKKDANGKTISNSKAEATAEAYRQLGLLDKVLKYIKDNDVAPSELGLSKTVYNKLSGGSSYQTAYSSSMGKSSSKGSKTSSKTKAVTGSGGNSARSSSVRMNKISEAPNTKLNIKSNNYLKAYANTMKSKSSGGASSNTQVCSRCGAKVPYGFTRCPSCGKAL